MSQEPSSPPGARHSSHRQPSDDRAASEVIGSLLLAGMTVSLAVVFGQSMLGAMPEPKPAPATFEISLAAGTEGWASGDETVSLRHAGGAPLGANETQILVSLGSEEHTYAGAELGGPFADGELTIGETWDVNLTVNAATYVDVQVVRAEPTRAVVADTAFTTPEPTCGSDEEPPQVPTWTQEPDPLAASHEGPVDVTATVEDDCSAVDTDDTPRLDHRFGDANFTDGDPAEQVGHRTWQASIPEPEDGWEAHAGEQLTYRLDPLSDTAGNTGTSEERSTLVKADEGEGSLTYVTDHVAFSGSLSNLSAAQNASDGGEAALLEEQATNAGDTRSEAYGTAHSSSAGTEDAGAATGSPDDAYARVDEDDEWMTVEGFQTFSGDIEAVELAFQAIDENGDSTDDELSIAYEVGNRKGKTKESYNASQLGASTDDDTVFLNITDDREWTWEDVGDLQVKAFYDRQGPLDGVTFAVDALWVRLTYEDPAYNMSIRADIEGLPEGDHDLELRYAVSDEPHHVQVWNVTSEVWEDRGSSLTSSSMRSWSIPLTSDEVEANDTRFRIVDDGHDSLKQSTVSLDYARGRTR